MKLFLQPIALAIFLILAGCAVTPPQPDEARDVAELLAFYRRMAQAPADEASRELQQAQAAYELQPGDIERLRVALLLGLPKAPWRDDPRVLVLLEHFSEAPADAKSARRDLAFFQHRLTAERVRLLKEEARRGEEAHARLSSALNERQRQLKEEHRRADEAIQKLEALRAMEREMRARKGIR